MEPASDSSRGQGAEREPLAAEGERLAGQSRRLRLLLHHLSGRAILARVEPDDLLQEVFLRALTAPSGLPERDAGEAALAGFLNRIARNVVVDVARALRTQKREGREAPLERSTWSRAGADHPAARTAGPATRVAARETEERLLETFAALAPDHRRVIGLRQLEGLSAARAAERMGRSETAVHSLYRRALEAWEQAMS